MKKLIATLVFMVGLSSCAQWNAIKVAGAAAGQSTADDALQVTLWHLCRATSIGSINRWIAGDQGLADAYNMVCSKVDQANVIKINE